MTDMNARTQRMPANMGWNSGGCRSAAGVTAGAPRAQRKAAKHGLEFTPTPEHGGRSPNMSTPKGRRAANRMGYTGELRPALERSEGDGMSGPGHGGGPRNIGWNSRRGTGAQRARRCERASGHSGGTRSIGARLGSGRRRGAVEVMV
ncbi:hypothetical protein GCM10009827_085000 [Dactylosporangium maewongense]|uniref:Uncharacterized protein n=1 Tax=Dactylosporangium maewongense TaxID=634393 RepID=A0ABN2C2E4_9ACTN